nr:MAG TPA: hypothetical protein [Caudoviricetes sp.]
MENSKFIIDKLEYSSYDVHVSYKSLQPNVRQMIMETPYERHITFPFYQRIAEM